MSDAPQGPGWWQASDYKWYPPQPPAPPVPESMPAPQGPPAYQAPPPQQPQAAGGQQWAQPAPAYPASGGVPPKKSKVPMILGVVALLLVLGIGGCVAILATAADKVDKELNENEARTVDSTQPGSTEPGQAPAEAEQPAPTEAPEGGGGPAGTREAPLAIGTEVDLGNGWRVKVNSADVSPGAAAVIAQADEYNDPADEGMRYIIVNMTASFAGTDEASTEAPFVGITTSVFGSDKVERNSYDTFVFGPEPEFDSTSELVAGGSTTGNIVVQVGAGETNLVMRIEPSFSLDSTESWIGLG